MPLQNNTSPENKKPNQNMRPLRTFQDDMAELIEKQGTSMNDILLAEQTRRIDHETQRTVSEENSTPSFLVRHIKGILLVGGVLIMIGILVLFLVFFFETKSGGTSLIPHTVTKTPSLVPTDTERTILITALDKKMILDAVEARRRSITQSLGKVEELRFVIGTEQEGTPVTTHAFIQTIAPRLPDAFIRILEPEFFFGVTQTGYRETFLIIKIKSFHTGFSTMLDWEPELLNDLSTLLARLDSAAYRSVTKQGAPVPTVFTDELFENRSVRVSRDASGTTSIIYALVDRDTIIVASSELSLDEALDRLSARRTVR